jgi:predicted phosphodiesterase
MTQTQGELRELLQTHGSWAAAARALGMPSSTLRSRADAAGVKIDGPIITAASTVVIDDAADLGDIRRLCADRGLDVEKDWIVVRSRLNNWGGPDGLENTQLRVDLEPRMGMLMPASSDPGWVPPKRKVRPAQKASELVCFLSDQHVPFHDKHLHEATVAWLTDHQPDRILLLGDLLDFDQVSRYARNDLHTATMQDTLDQGYEVLRDYRAAAPDADIVCLAGNHEERLRAAIGKQLAAITNLKRPGDDDGLLSVPFLLRFDELGIKFVGSDVGGYEHAAIKVTPELQAIHGWIAKKGSGSSARATLDHMRVSTICGHTHRASSVFSTSWSIDNEPRTLVALETGCMCEIRDGLSHAPRPDWQQGFATASCRDNGMFHAEMAVYVAGSLMWRDWTYEGGGA